MNTKPLVLTQDVIDAINGELEYTASLHKNGRADAEDYGTEGQLITLKVYTDKALEAWVMNPSDEQARDVLRKVAAIAVRALIQRGCPHRHDSKV